MKTLKRYQFLIILFIIVSLFLVAYSFFDEKNIPIVVRYVALFVCGFTISLEFLLQSAFKSIKKMIYLEKKMDLWNSISYRVKNAGETSFNEMPMGIIVFDDDFVIEWANNYAKNIFMSPLVERSFLNLNEEFAQLVEKRQDTFVVTLYGKVYLCRHMLRDHVIYLTDITEETNIQTKYKERMLALGILNLDNLDLATSTLDAQEKSLQMSNLIGILSDWAEDNNVCIKGYSEERYLLVMDYQTLQTLMKKEFKILSTVKEYCEKESIRMTASIGIACMDVPSTQLIDVATEQLELALNRGGNQAIVKIDDQITYFGAKSEAFEMRTPVYIRVKTEEFIDCIKKSSKVFILSHRDMDADAFGSSLAVRKIVLANGIDAKIVLDENLIDETVKTIYESIKLSHINLLDYFVPASKALKEMDDNALLVVVDCQYQYLLMNDKLLKKANRIAVIDHHRRNAEAINRFEFLYTQPSASSAVELLMEMLEYIDHNKLEITPIEATWMLMGVVIDTNNFTYHTTFRTFIVLAKLQSFGADMAKVQRFLRENFDEYVKRMSILNNLEIIEGGYGIAVCDDGIYERAFLAKIADNIITVNNIKGSFCIGRIEKDVVGISARSLDEANVQVIMEYLGGGGHYNMAATQLRDITLEEAKAKLIQCLKDHKEAGGKSMKVILTKDVKGKGKVNDVIDIPAGHANYLIREGQAIEATPDNIKQLEMSRIQAQLEQERYLKEMQELKKKVDSMSVKVQVKVGTAGKMFGSVSTKEIVEEFKNQNGIELDKRKILYDKNIDALGTYKIPIQLHKEVTATITLYVVENGAK